MNIVASNNTPQSAPTRPDAAQATAVAASVADTGDAATTQPSGFGAILSKNIADGAAADGKSGKPLLEADPADASHDPKSASATDPALLPPSIGLPTIPIDTASIGGVAKDDAGKDDRPTAADAATNDAVTPGSDLAAQLALVSQWNGLKPRVDAASAGDAAKTGALDTQGKPDTIRGAATPATHDAVPSGTVDATAATPDVATVVAAAPSAGLDRVPSIAPRSIATVRATRSATAASTTVAAAASHGASTAAVTDAPIDAKILDLARARAPDTRSVAQVADTAPLIAGIAGHPSTGDTATVSSFLAQVASQLASQAPSPVVTATAASTDIAAPLDTLREPVGTPAWSHEVGQAALRMAANDMQNVSLRLNPEHLGPLEVQMRVDNGIAHLQFSAAHVETRQALESSRTMLDQMFGNQGIKLGDWSVGQQSSNTSFARDSGSANAQGGRRDGQGSTDAGGSADTIATATIRTIRPLGLVDTFA